MTKVDFRFKFQGTEKNLAFLSRDRRLYKSEIRNSDYCWLQI